MTDAQRIKRLVWRLGAVAVLLFAGSALALLAACDWVDPGPPSYAGVVMETRGACHTILSDPMPDKRRVRYALKAEDSRRLGLKAGQRVTIRGKVAPVQDCAAAVVLAPEAG